jgi:acyl-CoA reductase-like NAD-dependent aldehyde dehydrogenase
MSAQTDVGTSNANEGRVSGVMERPMMNSQSVVPAVEPFLDGALSKTESETSVEVINPSNGQRLLEIPAGCEVDVNRAVISARRAFEDGSWSNAPASFRKRTLYKFADLISSNAPMLDALDAGEMGKPIKEAAYSASEAANIVRFCAEAIDKITGDVYNSDKNSFAAQRRVPRGVVGAIVPWNFPTCNAVLKIAPALAAGNSVVLKPSELASRSAIRLAELVTQAGLPPGVLNVVPGLGEITGRALGLHQDVDMVTFTGSTTVGKQMLEYSGQSNMKVVMAECGGKAPHIVFADVSSLDAVAGHIAGMLVTNQGQICSVGSRLLVERRIEAQLVERIVLKLKDVTIGDALDPRTTFGPLVSAKQCARVMRYIEMGQSEGAIVVTGGSRTLLETGGYFVEPTLFQNVASTARIAQEEIFGPVLSVIPFDDEAEAVRIANGTIYGLVAYAWTTDLSRAMRLVKGIRSSLLVNAAPPMGEGPGEAFSSEPSGQSGVGAEGGVPGMENYMRRQFVWINHA